MNRAYLKWVFLGVLLIAAMIGGMFLSGWILLLWLKLSQVPLEMGTYLKYVSAMDTPRVAPFAKQIKLSGFLGFGVPMGLYLLMLYGIFKSKPQSIHGEARFATASDLAQKDMFKPSETAIVVGQMNGKLVRFSGQQFVILAAPTRSGKGVGIVIPNLLSYLSSMVVLDINLLWCSDEEIYAVN
jgi:type IV secretion system protein VirD4